MEMVMSPILGQIIYSLMPLWLGVDRPLTGLKLDTTGLAQPFFIAGGLNEDNVAKAINTLLPMQSMYRAEWRQMDKKIMKRLEDL